MPLPLQTTDIESVPEAYRGAYIPGENGSFELDLGDQVTGLKSALKKERAFNADWKMTGLLPSQAAALVASLPEKSALDALLDQHRQAWDQEKATLTAERDEARKSEHKVLVNLTLETALTRAGALPSAIELLTDELGRRVKIEADGGKRVAKVMDETGATTDATFADLVGEAMRKFPSLFQGTGAGGGGTPPKQPKIGAKIITRSEFDALGPIERAKRIRDGWKLTD